MERGCGLLGGCCDFFFIVCLFMGLQCLKHPERDYLSGLQPMETPEFWYSRLESRVPEADYEAPEGKLP